MLRCAVVLPSLGESPSSIWRPHALLVLAYLYFNKRSGSCAPPPPITHFPEPPMSCVILLQFLTVLEIFASRTYEPKCACQWQMANSAGMLGNGDAGLAGRRATWRMIVINFILCVSTTAISFVAFRPFAISNKRQTEWYLMSGGRNRRGWDEGVERMTSRCSSSGSSEHESVEIARSVWASH